MFVVVPGYGYAKISQRQIENFGEMMEDYFAQRTQKKGLVLLVDARHKPTADDVSMIEFARYYEIPVCVVATKVDKLKPSQKHKQFKIIRETLNMSSDEKLFPFSSEKKTGRDEVWNYLIPMFES